jgi:hypothetical protein
MTIQQAELALLRAVLDMYARGHDDGGKEARKALRAIKPKASAKRKTAR